jgi:sigma-54 dependent transcriptional regulator, acetoin dehydrogenase operon transcriptional activator AcoR
MPLGQGSDRSPAIGDSHGRTEPAGELARPGVLHRSDVGDTMLAWERFLTGHPRAIAPAGNFVVSSWQRSLALGVNPASSAAPLLARGEAMRQLRLRNRDVVTAAASVFAELSELFAGSRSIMLLTDPDGVVLEAVGDLYTLDQGRDINLTQGGSWNEGVIGTNGIGTALATGRPAHVHAAEHFCEGIKRWTCAAAPIYEPGSGAILGVVDISGPPATYQRNNLALAVTAARQIEAAIGERAMQARMRLLEACLNRFSSTAGADAAGLVALDRDGRLVHVGSGVRAPVALGERLPGLSQGVPVEDWATRLPEGWRPDWFNPVADRGETIGAVLIIPTRPRSVASRPGLEKAPEKGSESDPRRSGFHHIVGDSPPMAALIARARLLAARRVSVLIEGETGTGKELLARALHGGEGPLIAFNCGAVSRELLASELFGHVRGAFTGATAEGRPGRFELAHQGTLCLDEIGELPLELQPVLLRALEEGVIYRVGDAAPRRVDVRLIAITNRTLRDEVAAGRFRRDLYYRIAVTELALPPLRARVGDVELLAGHFLRQLAARHGVPDRHFAPTALAALVAHSWPGNVRELRNAIETALLTAVGLDIELTDLPIDLRVPASQCPPASLTPVADEGADSLAAAERSAIERAMAGCQGNLAEAARQLGISRSTLYRKLERYGAKA